MTRRFPRAVLVVVASLGLVQAANLSLHPPVPEATSNASPPEALPAVVQSDGSFGSFRPTENMRLSPKTESALRSTVGLASSRSSVGLTASFNVTDVHIHTGVTLDVEGYDTLVFNAKGNVVIDGMIAFKGGKVYINSMGGTVQLDGSIIVSGNVGSNGTTGSGLAGGNGGDGGSGRLQAGTLPYGVSQSAGAQGFGGTGAFGSPLGSSGNPWAAVNPSGGVPSGPWSLSGWPVFYQYNADVCYLLAGGSAGGSNGTMGAGGSAPGQPFSIPFGGYNNGGHYYAKPPIPIGSPTVGISPPVAGGGSGAAGGCGWYATFCNSNSVLSAGGGGGGGGGAGGTVVVQTQSGALMINGSIRADGGNGGAGGNGAAPAQQCNGSANGGSGGGGGAGGAGGSIVLQGSPIVVASNNISARGGNGGVEGSAGNGYGAGVAGNKGIHGAGGGGGRMALYANPPLPSQISASSGKNASDNIGGLPTVTVITATLTNTPAGFMPKNGVFDTVCDSDGCADQAYTVAISPTNVSGIIKFDLSSQDHPDSSSTYRGYATNMCFNADCTDPLDTAPDYWFQYLKQPFNVFNGPADPYQTIQTSSAVNSATVTVSSRDYGGNGKLSATVTINGIAMPAAVAQTQELFARIPIDIHKLGAGCETNPSTAGNACNNGIADVWERQVTGDTRYLDQTEDNEVGPAGSNSLGDGYSAHDEYRGFAYFNGSVIVHKRTDPVNTKDVFYYDLAGVSPGFDPVRPDFTQVCTSTGTTPSTSCGKVDNILIAALPSSIQFYRLLDESMHVSPNANLIDYPSAKGRNNHNTQTNSEAYAIVYVSAFLNGTSQQPQQPGVCPGSRISYGDSDFANDGLAPIQIDNDAISSCLSSSSTFTQGVARAWSVAHETGHKLGLLHNERHATYAVVSTTPPSSLSSLAFLNFTTDSNAAVYAWFNEYVWLGQRTKGETPVNIPPVPPLSQNVLCQTPPFFKPTLSQNPYYRPDNADRAVYQFGIGSYSLCTGNGTPYPLILWSQDTVSPSVSELMNWFAQPTSATFDSWRYSGTHLQQMCFKRTCTVP